MFIVHSALKSIRKHLILNKVIKKIFIFSNFRWINEIDDDSEISEILKNAIGTQLPLDYDYKANKKFENDINMNTSTTVEFLKKIAPRCKDFLLRCQWEGKTVNCTDVKKFFFTIIKYLSLFF